jgi:hypothetical protein
MTVGYYDQMIGCRTDHQLKLISIATDQEENQVLKRILSTALVAAGGTAMGQIVSATFDILDGADPGAPTPFGVVVIDGFVDVNNVAGGAWTASGIRCVTSNGATLIYADGDENAPGIQPNLVNTGSSNNRFVTMISRPRGRNAAARFDNGGAATAGDYDPPGPNPSVTDPTEFNSAFFASPPMGAGDVGADGYVVRIALSAPGFSRSGMILGGPTPPFPNAYLLAMIAGVDDGSPAPGWVNSTFNSPTPTGGSTCLWWIPEPSSLTLLGLGLLAFRRR